MLDLRVERISSWLCLLVCLAGVVCGFDFPPLSSFGNLIRSVNKGPNTRNTSGDVKMIYESGGCVQFSGTSRELQIDVRLYARRTVRTVLLYLPPGTEPSDIQVKALPSRTDFTPFSRTDWPVTKEYSVYRWEGDVSALDIRVKTANRRFSICFMKVYDKTLKDYCECGDACHRNADVVCSGVCSKVVPDNCRMENVALNKTATMSTGYKGSNASSAVNGVTGTTFSAPGYNNDTTLWNCIHTAPGDNSPNWTVDLGRSYDFRYVTIYRRNTERDIMQDVQIKVGDKVCKTITWKDALPDRMVLDCGEVMRGRLVTLTRSHGFLNFCELQIWVCKPGYYGTKCSLKCGGHCEGNSVCDGIYGTCPGECEPGWFTEKCIVECNTGCSDNGCDKSSGNCFECRANFAGNKCKDCDNAHYGTDCSKQCGHCSKKDTPCGRKYGQCKWDREIRGYCEAGYQRTECTEKCSHGFYGIVCKHQCGSGCINGGCDPVTGHCSCRSGWKESNSKCDEPCDPGTYGKNCAGKCGPGCQRGNCNKETGYCDCKPGYQPSMCQEACADGFHGNCTTECGRCASDPVTKDIVFCDKESGFCSHDPALYGMNCISKCSIGCENSQCDSASGHCSCRPGWKESNVKCIERCDSGSYGKNCSQRCGQGCANICSKEMGFCFCISGFQSPLCQSKSDEQDYKTLTISMTAVVIFVFCILVGLIVSLSVLFRRHSRPAPCSSPRAFVPENRDVPPQGVVRDDGYINLIPKGPGTSTAGETGAASEDQEQTHYEVVL